MNYVTTRHLQFTKGNNTQVDLKKYIFTKIYLGRRGNDQQRNVSGWKAQNVCHFLLEAKYWSVNNGVLLIQQKLFPQDSYPEKCSK